MNIRQNTSVIILALAIIIAPVANLFHFIIPAYFLGKSAWIAFPAVAIAIIFIFHLTKINKLNRMTCFFLIALSGFLLLMFRELLYDANRSVFDFRYILLAPMYLILAEFFSRREGPKKLLATALIIQALLAAFIVVINVHFFPSVMIATDEFGTSAGIVFEGERTRDMLLASSITGNMILVGMFSLAFLKLYDSIKIKSAVFWLFQLLMIYAIALGGSRFPLVVGFCVLFLSVFSQKSLKDYFFILLIVASLLGLAYLFNFESQAIWRFDQDSGGRLDKFLMPIALIQDSISNFLIGPPDWQVANTFSKNGVGISDNSYMLLALFFGFLFACLFFLFFFSYFVWRKTSGLYRLFSAYLIIGFGMTNAILWDGWVFVAIFCWFVLLARKSDVGHLSAKKVQ